MKSSLDKHIHHIKTEENKLLQKGKPSLLAKAVNPLVEKVQDRIPQKLRTTLNTAFYKGFGLVFQKGSSYIEMTYSKNKLQLEHDLNNYAIDRSGNRKFMKGMDKRANQSNFLNETLSLVEGGVLGVLGIGLPDIPLFLAVMLKSIYEVALSYGFQYESEEEKTYILLMIQTALSAEAKQKQCNLELDRIGSCLDQGRPYDAEMEAQMKETANCLSDALLTAKFIQGFPVVGAVGGLVNYSILRKINRFAQVKYKKRYYIKKKMKTSM